MNCSSSVPNAEIGRPPASNAPLARSRTWLPTSGRPASESPTLRPPAIMFSPPVCTARPAAVNPIRNWNSCQTRLPQNTTHNRVARSASCSRVRASGSSLQILIIGSDLRSRRGRMGTRPSPSMARTEKRALSQRPAGSSAVSRSRGGSPPDRHRERPPGARMPLPSAGSRPRHPGGPPPRAAPA